MNNWLFAAIAFSIWGAATLLYLRRSIARRFAEWRKRRAMMAATRAEQQKR